MSLYVICKHSSVSCSFLIYPNNEKLIHTFRSDPITVSPTLDQPSTYLFLQHIGTPRNKLTHVLASASYKHYAHTRTRMWEGARRDWFAINLLWFTIGLEHLCDRADRRNRRAPRCPSCIPSISLILSPSLPLSSFRSMSFCPQMYWLFSFAYVRIKALFGIVRGDQAGRTLGCLLLQVLSFLLKSASAVRVHMQIFSILRDYNSSNCVTIKFHHKSIVEPLAASTIIKFNNVYVSKIC